MRRTGLVRTLLALAFLASQALGLVHATEHELAGGEVQVCDLCAVGHLAGPAPATAGTTPPAAAIAAPAQPRPQAPAAAAVRTRPPARAPPSLPA